MTALFAVGLILAAVCVVGIIIEGVCMFVDWIEWLIERWM
jgi:hypothetical protein